MNHPLLKGLTILVVEDEPFIAMDIAVAFEESGAHITSTNTLKHAVLLVEHDGLSGAILDHALQMETAQSFAGASRSEECRS